jgi:putative transposase
MENFWSTLKTELVYRASWRTRDEPENAIFAYIDGWYNNRRIQAGLGDVAPTSTRLPGTPLTWISRTRPAPPWSQPAPGNEHSVEAGVAQA